MLNIDRLQDLAAWDLGQLMAIDDNAIVACRDLYKTVGVTEKKLTHVFSNMFVSEVAEHRETLEHIVTYHGASPVAFERKPQDDKDWLIVGNNLSEKPSGKCVYCRSDIEYIGYPDDWKPSRKNICYVCDFLIALGLIPPPKMTLETKKGAKNGVQ